MEQAIKKQNKLLAKKKKQLEDSQALDKEEITRLEQQAQECKYEVDTLEEKIQQLQEENERRCSCTII